MPESIVYTAVATSSGDGRNGHVRSSDGILDADVRVPQEMGGPGGATNPEQLFAAGYAACFHSALKATSKQSGVPITDSAVTAEVGIGPDGAGGFGLAVTLHVELGGTCGPMETCGPMGTCGPVATCGPMATGSCHVAPRPTDAVG